MFDTLISSQQLAALSMSEDVVIIDCRFDLANPDWGYQQYFENHIPKAWYAHLDKDLSSKVTPTSGRHPLPNMKVFCQRIANWNIRPGTQVVVYDQHNGGFAGRLWWMLKYIGHKSVALLDGGYKSWQESNYPTSVSIPEDDHTVFKPYSCEIQANMLLSSEEVLHKMKEHTALLIDARSPDRFRGENETMDKIGGHIPGAINYFYANNVDEKGFYKTPALLREALNALLSNYPKEEITVYCGSGVTSCSLILAFVQAGMGFPKLYAGSWSEWINDVNHPIATGD